MHTCVSAWGTPRLCACSLDKGNVASGWGREQPRPRDAGHEAGWEPTRALEDPAQTGVRGTEDLLLQQIPTEEGREMVLLLCLLH